MKYARRKGFALDTERRIRPAGLADGRRGSASIGFLRVFRLFLPHGPALTAPNNGARYRRENGMLHASVKGSMLTHPDDQTPVVE
jgi:hypothetical protein